MWYPDKDFVVWVHDVMLAKFGGFSGFERGLDCFDVILAKVRDAKGLYQKAAVLLREIVVSRIFADGNHRTAYEVAKTFLEMNGGRMKVTGFREVITFIKGVMNYDIVEIEAWLEYGKVPKRP